MIKKLIIFSISFVASSTYAMEQIKPWAQQKSTIRIKMPLDKSGLALHITDATKIIDIKNKIEEDDNIPTAQQNIVAQTRYATSLWLTTRNSEPLANDAVVKQVMSDYNTTNFQLFLTTHAQQIAQKPELLPWVKAATVMYVEGLKPSLEVPITDATTLLDIKNFIEKEGGVPHDLQILHAKTKMPWTFGLITELSAPLILNDTDSAKQFMSQHNTDVFTFFINQRLMRKKQDILKQKEKELIKNSEQKQD